MLKASTKLSGKNARKLNLVVNRFLSTLQSRGTTQASAPLVTMDHRRLQRHQHQLVAVECEQRDAMRSFLDSLQAAAATFRLDTAVVEETGQQHELERPQSPEGLQQLEHAYRDISTVIGVEEEPTVEPEAKEQLSVFKKGFFDLGRAIRRRDLKKSVALFEEAIGQNLMVPHQMVASLFYLAVKDDAVLGYKILQYYNHHPETNGDLNVDMYRRVCYSVKLLSAKTRDVHSEFTETLLKDIAAMDLEVKKNLYPPLILSLVTQKFVSVGFHADGLYSFLMETDFEPSVSWLQGLLFASKYNRQRDLPFHDILARLVAMGAEPHPLLILPAIQNMFPYVDLERTYVALEAYQTLLRQSNETIESPYREHCIDLSTLEGMSTGAAHGGSSQLIQLVWDVLEECNYKPTQTIYENTILAFACCEKYNLEQTFAAVVAMKDQGFEVSGPLIRSVSRAVRSNVRILARSRDFLASQETSWNFKTLECFNILMSCYAERGDANQTLELLETLKEYGLTPDANTYSFGIEALGKDLHRRKKKDDRSRVHRNLDLASSILTMMEEDGVSPSADVVRNYVELLCLTEEISTATSVVDDFLSNGETKCVNNKTLYRVALANVEAGNLEEGKRLASLTSEVIPVLHRKIRSMEQRQLYVKQRGISTGKKSRKFKKHQS